MLAMERAYGKYCFTKVNQRGQSGRHLPPSGLSVLSLASLLSGARTHNNIRVNACQQKEVRVEA